MQQSMMSSRRRTVVAAVLATVLTLPGCGSSSAPPTSGSGVATVRLVLITPTTRIPMTAAQETCARFIGPTHIHLSWRNLASVDMTPVPPDRYEVTVTDVPTNTPVQVQANNENGCVNNTEGIFVTDTLANNVRLTRVVSVVGMGQSLEFTVASNGTVTP